MHGYCMSIVVSFHEENKSLGNYKYIYTRFLLILAKRNVLLCQWRESRGIQTKYATKFTSNNCLDNLRSEKFILRV